MPSLGDFSKRIRRRAADIERNINRTVRQVALVADRELVLATPVDTGRARSNWFVNLGAPNRSVSEPYFPGEKGSTASSNSQAAIDQATQVISRRQIGQDIYISNNLDYIGSLNDGSSAQAPAQFVESAVQRAVNVVKGAQIVR